MSQPNIVVILADDLGYGDLGCYGANPRHVETPNIDALARDGVRFTDAHSPSSVCTPSRYNLMTGRYCWRTWAKTGCVWANDPCLIERDRPTIASVLRDGGYETAMVGKWHLGFGSPHDPDWDPLRGPNYNRPLTHGPLSCGFDAFFGIPAVGQFPHFFVHNDRVVDLESGDPFRIVPDPRASHLVAHTERRRSTNPELFTQGSPPEYLSEELAVELTERAVEFIDRGHDRPFFLYFAHRNVHAPIDPHPRFRGTSGIGEYGDFIHELDWSVGAILAALDRNHLTDNTVVIFSSDNGATHYHQPVLHVNYNGHMANGPFRGSKTEVYEGGHRVPFIVRWPNHTPTGTTCDHVLALTDLLSTCAEIAGVDPPAGASPDGESRAQSFLQPQGDPGERSVLIHDSMGGTLAVRHHEWKLIFGQNGGGILGQTEVPTKLGPPGQLFNLAEDPSEQCNRYMSRPDVVNELLDMYLNIRASER